MKAISPRVLDLTQGSRVDYRVVDDGDAGPWCGSVRAACGGSARQRARLPTRWRLFGMAVKTIDFGVPFPDPSQALPPELLSGADESAQIVRHGLSLNSQACEIRGGFLDLVPILGPPRNGREAFLIATCDVARSRDLVIHAGADWSLRWWIDGRLCLDTLRSGNGSAVCDRAHEFPVRLAKGRHRMVVQVVSGNGGWSFAACATAEGRHSVFVAGARIETRRRFVVGHQLSLVSCTASIGEGELPELNGSRLEPHVPGLRCEELLGISPANVHQGTNELIQRWSPEVSHGALGMLGVPLFKRSGDRGHLPNPVRLFGLTKARLRGSPVLGSTGPDHVTLSCRTDARVAVKLTVAERTWESAPDFTHRFHIDGLQTNRRVRYRLEIAGESAATGSMRPLAGHLPFTIGILGDPSPDAVMFGRTIKAVGRQHPDMLLLLGDLVDAGRCETQWHRDFNPSSRQLMTRTPCYAVIGNHDQDSPIYDALIATPGGRNWHQVIGPLLLIGIDGGQDWSCTSVNYCWLDALLAGSRAPFVVFCTHYPAWTSSPHGELALDGRPRQRTITQAREALLPLLTAHRVTAIISGHSHCYERSRIGDGPWQITSGGAGGYLYTSEGTLNPHSQVYVPAHHYCLLRVSTDGCEIVAHDLDGHQLDRCLWKPR